jgi:hypothetical protein
MSQKEIPDVKVGQIWADDDIREQGRTLEIVAVEDGRVVARSSRTGRTTTIRQDRFRPSGRGYRLVKDVTP